MSIETRELKTTLENILNSGIHGASENTVSKVRKVSDKLEELAQEMYETDIHFPGYAEEMSPQIDDLQRLLDAVWHMLESADLL